MGSLKSIYAKQTCL